MVSNSVLNRLGQRLRWSRGIGAIETACVLLIKTREAINYLLQIVFTEDDE